MHNCLLLLLQVKRCKTDSFPYLEWGNEERPEATNLLTMYQLSTGKTQVRDLWLVPAILVYHSC
jgi:hypothetical protein